MSDSWEERQRGMEEGYFKQKDNELIAKMRAKLNVEKAAEGVKTFDCPKCDGRLETGKFDSVEIDLCSKCGGIWLDAGEMQQIAKKDDKSWFGKMFN